MVLGNRQAGPKNESPRSAARIVSEKDHPQHFGTSGLTYSKMTVLLL